MNIKCSDLVRRYAKLNEAEGEKIVKQMEAKRKVREEEEDGMEEEGEDEVKNTSESKKKKVREEDDTDMEEEGEEEVKNTSEAKKKKFREDDDMEKDADDEVKNTSEAKKKKFREEDSEEEIKEEDFDVNGAIKDLVDTKWSGSNDEQGKAVQLMKGLAFSDAPEANDFMKKVDDFMSSMKKEEKKGKKAKK